MNRYVMYLRKSRADLEAELRGEEETLKRHENILKNLAKVKNIPVEELSIYREVVSGETIASRPMMQQLLLEVEQGIWEAVLVVEVERLARGDTIDQGVVAQAFKYSNTKIITPTKTYNPNNEFDEEYFEFGLFMSRREYKTINRRLQQGRMQSAKEGKYVGNIPPYGYKRKALENQKGFTLEPCPKESLVVKFIFDLYANGEVNENGFHVVMGIGMIGNKLNQMKIPTRKGGLWTSNTLKDILTNPVYIGLIRWNYRKTIKRVVDTQVVITRPRAKSKNYILEKGMHPPIIEDKLYNHVQDKLAKNISMPLNKNKTMKNPLAGLITCGLCGFTMQRKSYLGGCSDVLLCPTPACSNVSSFLYLVEERVLGFLKEWFGEYIIEIKHEEISKMNMDTQITKLSIKELNDELETMKIQRDNLHDLLEQGIYSIDMFQKRSDLLEARMDVISQEIEYLEKKYISVSNSMNKEDLIPRFESILEIYNSLESIKEKNELLKSLIDKIVYRKKEGGRISGNIDAFALEIYPKLPCIFFCNH